MSHGALLCSAQSHSRVGGGVQLEADHSYMSQFDENTGQVTSGLSLSFVCRKCSLTVRE